MHAVTLTVNPSLDTSTATQNVLVDRKVRCDAPAHEPGGGGVNVARVLHRLGSSVTAIYPAGGPTGQTLVGLLEAEGIDQRPIEIAGWTRENFTVMEEATRHQYQFIMPGPELTEAELDRCLAAVREADPVPAYIVASGSLAPGVPEDVYARVVRMGRELGAKVIVDTAGQALREAAAEGAYLLKPNLPELETLAGRELVTEAEQEAAASALLNEGLAEMLIVSLGRGGALVATRDGITRLRAPTVRTESRVGAGDTMVGGIVHALMRGDSTVDAARLGIAAGAATAMTPGTQLCRKEDVERLYNVMLEES